jgi:hypothetical protein
MNTRTLEDTLVSAVAASSDAIAERLLDEADNPSARVELDPDNVKQGLLKLVLTLVKILHEVLERQAIHRIEAGTINAEQIEAIGATLRAQREEISRLRDEFDLEESDLELDLGGLLSSLDPG